MISTDRLGAIPFFAEVPADVRELLAEKMAEESFPAGQTIFSEGEEGDALFFIAEGRVAILDVYKRQLLRKKAFTHEI